MKRVFGGTKEDVRGGDLFFFPLGSGTVNSAFPGRTQWGDTVSIYYVRFPSGRVRHAEQASTLPLQLQREMRKSPSDGEQWVHPQQQTLNYQIPRHCAAWWKRTVTV